MSEITSTPACPEAATLRALLDGSLPAEQLATVQGHVDQCSACEAALRQMTVGGESWIGMAAGLKERDERSDEKLAAAMNQLKASDGSVDGEHEQTDPQRTLDFLTPSDDPKLLGTLGQHEISEIIGWGGMGVVLKAYDPSLHRVVAVKVLASHLAHHAVARKRFIREAQAAAAVCHDNVVTIHAIDTGFGLGIGEPEGVSPRTSGATSGANTVRGLTPSGSPMNQALPKIIMQFVAGGSLQERIDQDGPLELKEVLRISMQTAAGLAAAHVQGVVHRDVKPANILLENGVQRVKLTDFGLARVMDDASLTLSGVIAGTPQYMAPEQAWGRDVDARADLFSLGAVMYAMCSGHSPFRARTTMAVLKRVCEDSPRPLRAINPDVPEWLVAIIEKLLAKKPEDRFQTATEVSELLGRWLAHVQQPNVVPAPLRLTTRDAKRSINPGEPESVSSRTSESVSSWISGKTSLMNHESGNVRGLTPAGSPGFKLLSAKLALLPMLGVATTVAIMLLLIVAARETNNLPSFLGFAAWNLVATFAVCSVFRTAWNTSSWLIWIGAVLLLPVVGQQFVMASSDQPNPAAPQLIYAVQALTAFALLFGLLFVRPFFVRGSEHWMRERLTGWQRLFAIACFTIIGTPLTLAVMYFFSSSMESPKQTAFKSPQSGTKILLTDPAVIINRNEPQLLSNSELDDFDLPPDRRAGGVSPPVNESPFDTIDAPTIGGLTPPARQGNSGATPAAIAESLKPLLGRWVVLTLQGNEPPFASAAAGGMGSAMSAPYASTPGSTAAVTPSTTDQSRSLEFHNGRLSFDDAKENQFNVEVRRDRELLMQDQSSGEIVRHGVFTIADDRLVICWTSRNQPLPRGFQPKPHEQLVVCRREWSRPSHTDDKGNAAVEAFHENSKLPKAEMPFSPREAGALQAAWAEKSKSPVEVTNSIGMKLRVIPPGSFGDPRTVATLAQSVGGAGAGSFGGMMGSGGADAGAGSSVAFGPGSGCYFAVSGPILVGTHEVTVAQFRQFVEDSKYVTEAERSENGQPARPHSWRTPEIEQDSDQHPVVNVTFEDALAFCHWLSLKEKKPYRLLTRREWEFCARAGSWLPVTLGPGKLAYRSQFFTTTAPVGSYLANSFGLHDFIGNVAEWAWRTDNRENDPPRNPLPNTGIVPPEPAVFCGGDFRQHINRSQPSEWLHPVASTTPPMIGFRVACDLTAASVVSLPKHWPTNQLFLSQELVRVRTLADSAAKSNDDKPDNEKPGESTTSPAGKLINAVWLEMLVRAEQMPYAVEWLDFEIERRLTPIDKDANDFVHGRIADAGAEAGWKSIELAPAMQLLEQTDFAPDPIATPFLNPMLTMPIPKAVTGQWASPDQRGGLPPNFVRLEPAIQKPQLFRFLDFDTPHGSHYYRVRLMYRVPGITPESVQTTSWFLSMDEAEIDVDFPGKRKLPENIPVIELKPQLPDDSFKAPPDQPGINGRYRSRGKIPSKQ